jgi:hypothetical protein
MRTLLNNSVEVASNPSGQIIITQLNGEHHTAAFTPTTLVEHLKQQLTKSTGIPANLQQLIFNKTLMQVYSLISSFNLSLRSLV